MENRVATRVGGVSNLPRVGGVAGDNDEDNEKVYYGFGVFMGLPLADLKAMKDDFVEQQALTGGPPLRRALEPSTILDSRTHCVESDENGHDHQGDVHMAPPHALQQQQQHHLKGYERQHDEGQQRDYMGEGRSRFAHEPPSDEQGGEDDDADANSDGSDDFGNKSHSLNFILH
ncbi:hypothetical protein KXD40_000026 [Peronospora effusa]|uniref:Uncharacterized protein n=1 Tax=Peronospora effusa TaxID=542832 RepID=A0A3M6VR86_9STRA|nr:hypothetical protein DD238_003923 [Peronospora effusa]UIZ20886.1 hypothetical protein KXD40_000026 [Peronospora effusa]CAI5705469.1 unnamed protein product [Peronospora effusa]